MFLVTPLDPPLSLPPSLYPPRGRSIEDPRLILCSRILKNSKIHYKIKITEGYEKVDIHEPPSTIENFEKNPFVNLIESFIAILH